MPPRIIGLVGRSRSGKDTVAGLIQQMFPGIYTIARLSAPIKEAARALFLFNEAQLEGAEKEQIDPRWNITPRAVFQRITDATMREVGHDFFTRVLYEKYERGTLGTHIVIPDVRYMHDIAEIHRRGGWVIKVERPLDALPNRYACEDHLDAIQDLPTLRNDTTLDALRDQLTALIKSHGVSHGGLGGADGGRNGSLPA